MTKLPHKLTKELHHKRLSRSISAMAGLAGSISAATGIAAAVAAPTGLSGLLVDMGLDSEPLIVSLAPIIAGIAVALATMGGIAGFYSWIRDRLEDDQLQEPVTAKSEKEHGD
jgi:hypothetical protein